MLDLIEIAPDGTKAKLGTYQVETVAKAQKKRREAKLKPGYKLELRWSVNGAIYNPNADLDYQDDYGL